MFEHVQYTLVEAACGAESKAVGASTDCANGSATCATVSWLFVLGRCVLESCVHGYCFVQIRDSAYTIAVLQSQVPLLVRRNS